MNKPLREEQANMRKRWADPAYRWQHDSNLRRRFDARRKLAEHEVHETGHDVETALHSSSEEAAVKGEEK